MKTPQNLAPMDENEKKKKRKEKVKRDKSSSIV